MADNTIAIHIANSALYRLGEKPITAFDDTTTTARACKELYPDVRDTMLSWQAWPFATVRQQLAKLTATPPSDFAHYFMLPTQPAIIRVIDNTLEARHIPYQREIYVNPLDPNDQQNVLATDADTVILRYIGRTTEGVWSPLFVATTAVYLAQALTMAITGKSSVKGELLQELYGANGLPGLLVKLRDLAGYEDDPREIPQSDAYLAVRGGGWDSAPHRLW